MGRRAKGAAPAYRLHKATGQAVVTVAGRQVYLGKFDTEASRQEYARLIGGVGPILSLFMIHARSYYRRKDGSATTEVLEYSRVVEAIRKRAGLLRELGPGLMRDLRDFWLKAGLHRSTINQRLARVPRIFRWAAGEGLCDPATALTLSMAPRLAQNRSRAVEGLPVSPVAVNAVVKTLGALERTWADAARFQLLTGARPGEALSLRVEQIERHSTYGIYRTPGKMAYQNRPRVVILPQRALTLVDSRSLSGLVFPGRSRLKGRSTSGYAHAVQRACRVAGVEHWHPHQLRHTWATLVRARGMRVEDVQAALGHAQLDTAEIYAERDLTRLADILAGWRVPGLDD